MSNDLQVVNTELRPLREAVENEEFISLLRRAAGERAGSFAIGIINAANANPDLLKCELNGILTAGLTAAEMNLSLSPALGQACILPFSKSVPVKKDTNGRVLEWGKKYTAQFVVQVRGIKNLALRTNQYAFLNDFAVYASQKVIPNQMTGVPTIEGVADPKTPITHYGAYLKLTSGYEHAVIWPVDDIMEWGKKYSPTYDKQKEKFNEKSKWVTDFDGQARKTVMKFLINHYGVISERDKAYLEAVDERDADEIIDGQVMGAPVLSLEDEASESGNPPEPGQPGGDEGQEYQYNHDSVKIVSLVAHVWNETPESTAAILRAMRADNKIPQKLTVPAAVKIQRPA